MFNFRDSEARDRITSLEFMSAHSEKNSQELKDALKELTKQLCAFRDFMSVTEGQNLVGRVREQDKKIADLYAQIRNLQQELHRVEKETIKTGSVLASYLQSLSRGDSQKKAASVAVTIINEMDQVSQAKNTETVIGDVATGGGDFSGTGNNIDQS